MTSEPNVLFLILDSLRADRVSCYGHDRETTPALDEFAQTATRYEQAYTPAPWTLPTHCSLFSGLYPSEHGVTNAFPDSSLRLPASTPTLAEKLSERGYRTAGFSNNPWVGKTAGLDRGFDDYVEWNLEIGAESTPGIHDRIDRFADRLNGFVGHAARQPIYLLKRPFFTDSLTDRAKRWINHSADDEPWFCFMNLMEAHSPYFPRGWAFEELGLEPPGPIEPRVLNTKLLAYVMGHADLSDDHRRRVLEFYDAAVRYQDRKVSELLDLLRSEELFEDTLIVICSDHGKTLGEFDRSGTPPHYLRDINTRVPLVVKNPGQEASEVESSPIELRSVHDHVLDGGQTQLLNRQPEPDVALVEDRVPHTGGDEPDGGMTFWRGLATGDSKYVRSETVDEYVLEGSGYEESISSDVETMDELREALAKRVEHLGKASEAEEGDGVEDLERGVRAQLEDLGYM